MKTDPSTPLRVLYMIENKLGLSVVEARYMILRLREPQPSEKYMRVYSIVYEGCFG